MSRAAPRRRLLGGRLPTTDDHQGRYAKHGQGGIPCPTRQAACDRISSVWHEHPGVRPQRVSLMGFRSASQIFWGRLSTLRKFLQKISAANLGQKRARSLRRKFWGADPASSEPELGPRLMLVGTTNSAEIVAKFQRRVWEGEGQLFLYPGGSRSVSWGVGPLNRLFHRAPFLLRCEELSTNLTLSRPPSACV